MTRLTEPSMSSPLVNRSYVQLGYLQVKNQPQMFKDINVKLKMLKEHINRTLHNIGLGKDFLNKVPFTQELWPAIYKWDLIKLKCLSSVNEIIN